MAQGEHPAVTRERQPELFEVSTAIRERLAEERIDGRLGRAGEPEDVERDVDHRNLAPDRRRRRLPAEACLEGDERQDRTIAPAEDLAVEDPVPAETSGTLDDLRELVADVVEVAREEPD